MTNPIESTRQSWNIATQHHNSHKGDQAAFFRAGGDVLFPEELSLLGDLSGLDVVHLQCNSGQDTLGLARRAARVVGVDLSDEAVDFAQRLSTESGIPATFVRSELLEWLHTTEERFDVAFSSYGANGWIQDLDAWASGIARILKPGGRLVYVEFHPVIWSIGPGFTLSKDDYFESSSFVEPVQDYVAASGDALGATEVQTQGENTTPSHSWQHGLGKVLTAIAGAGLMIDAVHEYPYSNGYKFHPEAVKADGRRWVWPEGVPRLPLMYGLSAHKLHG